MKKSVDTKRILIIADSLALPGHGNRYELDIFAETGIPAL